MELRWPHLDLLDEYVAALRTGWSPNTMRAEQAADELEAIEADPEGFIASLVDRDGAGPPIQQPDGTITPRLPGYRKWMWDGELVGNVNFRWQPGTDALPDYVLGHIGYTVFPWRRRRGYATEALGLILHDARAEGLSTVELTTDADNVPSQRVIERNGGIRETEFEKFGVPSIRYRIRLD